MIKDAKSFFETQSMFICDQISLKILDANEAALRLSSLSKEDLLKKTLHELVEEVTPDVAAHIQQNSQASTFDKVWKIKAKDTSERIVQFSSHILTYCGKPAKLLVAHDVSELVDEIDTPTGGFSGFSVG